MEIIFEKIDSITHLNCQIHKNNSQILFSTRASEFVEFSIQIN